MANTPYLDLALLVEGAQGNESYVNKMMVQMDAGVLQGITLAISNDGTPTDYNSYIVGASPTGEFAGATPNDFAYYQGQWFYITPREGWRMYVQDTGTEYQWDGAAWSVITPPSVGGSDTQVQFNDGGTLAGNAAFTFNKTTGVITHPQVRNVFVGGDLKAVVEGISDSSIAKPYVVKVHAGVYAIGDNSIAVPSYVTVHALGTVILDYTGNTTKTAFTMATGAVLRGLGIQSHLSSGYSISVTGTGSYVIDDASFVNCSRCVDVNNAAASVTMRGVTLLPFSSAMVTGIKVGAGDVSIRDVTVGGTFALTNVVWADSADANVHWRGVVSVVNSNVANAIYASNSASLEASEYDIHAATRGVYALSQASITLGNGMLDACDYGMYAANASTSVQGVGVQIKDAVVSTLFAGDGVIMTGTGIGTSETMNIHPGAQMLISFLDTFAGDESHAILGELHVGTAMKGSETCMGEGDSYTNGMLVYTYDGSSYADVTAAAKSSSGSTFAFPNLNVNTAVYWASAVSDGADFVKHHGLKFDIETAQVGGEIVFEYWNGSAWIEFPGMCTGGASPYYPAARQYFNTAGSCQTRYNIDVPNDSWAKNDDPSVGTSYYWVRARIASTLTTAPVLQQSKLHSSRREINNDGWPEYFGNARPIGTLPWDLGLVEAANASPADQDVFISDNLGVGRKENLFANTATDRIGFTDYLPLDLDTSCPVLLRFSVRSAAGGGDIDWVVRWGYSQDEGLPDDDVYLTTTAAPTTGPNEQSVVSSEAAPTAVNKQKTYQFKLDLSDMVARRAGGFGDLLWVSIERTSGDTHAGDVAMINLKAYYYKWCDGGHVG